ncbi:MAG: hypothetical protein FWH27_03455 [Planctomycetaceae bacterium]|nr:hypothetical protein [Planctomycetaceae bacterium]
MKKDSVFGIVTLVSTTNDNPQKGISAMKVDIIIDQDMQKVKLILDGKAGIVGPNLTADDAENVVKLIEQASRKANCEAFVLKYFNTKITKECTKFTDIKCKVHGIVRYTRKLLLILTAKPDNLV